MPEIVGARLLVGAVTAIANEGSDAVVVPSLTLITMLPNVPVVPVGGVPLSRPIDVSNDAQLGLPEIANISVLPSGSLAVGTNAYAVPASTLVIGTPDTVIRQIGRIREAVGISHFNCSFWFGDMYQERVLRSMELFAREVMPALA